MVLLKYHHNVYIFSLSYNINIFHINHLLLMGKEMLSTCMLDLENECKPNLFVQN